MDSQQETYLITVHQLSYRCNVFKYIVGTLFLSFVVSVGVNNDNKQPQYMVYHMGAEWCPPCQQMKQTTWKDNNLKKYMEDNNFDLRQYDADTPEHKKFFKYYSVNRYPTLIILDRDNLKEPLSKTSGYKSANSVKSILEGIRKDK